MTFRFSRILMSFGALAILGAGCLPDVQSQQAAQPLVTNETAAETPRTNGFGALPTIQMTQHPATVKLTVEVPPVPLNVTVLRPKRGTPNDTQFRNLANALGISDGFIGNAPNMNELSMDWLDGSGFHWTYKGTERLLEFTNDAAPAEPLTLSTLPSSITLLEAGNTFLVARGVPVSAYGPPMLDPDWNQWWTNAQTEKRCMDRSMLLKIRVIASSAALMVGGLPVLPASSSVACVAPEFPARLTIRYRAIVDGRAVVRADGTFVSGIELVMDASRMSVVSGRIILPTTDPDRSDYPALSEPQVLERLTRGGLNGAPTNFPVSSYEFASLQLKNPNTNETYLVPSLIGHGTYGKPIVVPLIAQ